MLLLKSLYSLWQRLTRAEQIGWIGLLLSLSCVLWHVLFITDLMPGPYPLVAQVHQLLFFTFWLLLFAIVPICFIFPATTLRRIKHRWLKIILLGLLGAGTTALLIPVAIIGLGIGGLLSLLILAICFDIIWILTVVQHTPGRVRLKNEIAFSALLALMFLLTPIGGYEFESLDRLSIQEWGKSYHVSYMNFRAPGKLTLFECGPARVFCRKIYHFCEYGGPSSDATLTWADDILSLTFNDSVIYQRYKSQDNRLVNDPGASVIGSHNGNCQASQWN